MSNASELAEEAISLSISWLSAMREHLRDDDQEAKDRLQRFDDMMAGNRAALSAIRCARTEAPRIIEKRDWPQCPKCGCGVYCTQPGCQGVLRDPNGEQPVVCVPSPLRQNDLAVQELKNILFAERFNRDHFHDDTEFADWARSRCRFTLDKLGVPVNAEPSVEKS